MHETILIALLAALAAAAATYFWLQTRASPAPALIPQVEEPERLQDLIEATVGTTGETYFYALVRELSQFLHLDSVFLASCIDDEADGYQTLAYWCDGSYIMNHRLSLPRKLSGDSGRAEPGFPASFKSRHATDQVADVACGLGARAHAGAR